MQLLQADSGAVLSIQKLKNEQDDNYFNMTLLKQILWTSVLGPFQKIACEFRLLNIAGIHYF